LSADTTLGARTESAIHPSRAQSRTFADDTVLPFSLPSICQKKVTAAFDGGRISSDGGVLLLAGADKRLRPIDTLAGITPDHRDQALFRGLAGTLILRPT
jgi:Transposase DDE domain group 1